jgi:hypothetical protein
MRRFELDETRTGYARGDKTCIVDGRYGIVPAGDNERRARDPLAPRELVMEWVMNVVSVALPPR